MYVRAFSYSSKAIPQRIGPKHPHWLSVLRVRLPWPDDAFPLQPDFVEPAVEQDPAGMPCTGCTEPEFPFYDLMPGTVSKTQKISGLIPKDVPAGVDHVTYMAHAAAAKIAAPKWSKEDMFVV